MIPLVDRRIPLFVETAFSRDAAARESPAM